jgi:site-specific DNA recombinase
MTGIIWARVSTSEQELGYSLDSQVHLLQRAAADRHIPIIETFRVHETGSRAESRRHFQDMLRFVAEHKVSHVLVFKIDRLARNYRDFYRLQELIEKGISFFIVNENKVISNGSTSQERFTFRMMGDIAQLEAEQIGERTRLGMEAKLSKGEITWDSPIGYKNVQDPADPTGRRRTVVVDPERWPTVLKAHELYSTGAYPFSDLRDELTRLGLTSKAGKRRPSGPVSRRCVEEMLKNRFYIGEFWDKKRGVWVRHNYPTFIPAELFERVQRRLKANQRNTKGRRDDERFFFKPFLRCGYCGAAITAYEPKPGRVYYDCAQSHTKTDGKKRCSDSSVYTEGQIDKMLIDAIGKLYVNDDIAARIREHLRESHTVESAASRRELKRLQARYTERTNHLGLIYEDRLAKIISVDDYTRQRTKIEGELSDIRDQIERLTEHNLDYQHQGSEILELLKGFRDTYVRQGYEGKARILGVMMNRVVLYGKEADFIWHEPFGTLFSIGELVLRSEKWGE